MINVKEILNIKFHENLFSGYLVTVCGHVDEEIRRETWRSHIIANSYFICPKSESLFLHLNRTVDLTWDKKI